MLSFDPTALFWLPEPPLDWRSQLATALDEDPTGRRLRGFCSHRLSISQLRSVAARMNAAEASGAHLSALREVRLGLIGAGTLDFLADALPGTAPRFGMRMAVAPVVYNAFGNTFGDIGLEGPLDCAAILPDLRSFARPNALLDPDGHRRAVVRAVDVLERMIAAVRSRSTCAIVLATIPLDPDRLLSSSDRAMWGSDWRFTVDLNTSITELAQREALALWDLEAVASAIGARTWRDPVSLLVAKSPFGIDLAPVLADRLCAIVAALMGKGRRALVLDLDNTCWGGVIGDDGLDSIVIGQGDPAGEAHIALQSYALALRQRGVPICVCSKNDDETAREPFRSHPDMLLREEHIAVFQANWSDKATNLQSIADQLSLNPDALVFVDDNPAERARVRQIFPEVAVPELPDDPAFFTSFVAAGGYFENPLLNLEDLGRAAAYRDNAKRAEIRETLGSYDEYLRSLDMTLMIRPFDGMGRARIAQLIAKSNQFNLTTRRRSEAEVTAIEAADGWLGLQFRLSDTFGDNGMICVVILRFEGDAAIIDTWLMSCRVLERQVEQAVLNEIARCSRERGASKLIGEYIATTRNAMVKNHYSNLGFTLLERDTDDHVSRWMLDLPTFQTLAVQMMIAR